MRIGVLGPLLVTDGGKELPLGGPKQRAVLALLVAHPGEAVSVAAIVDGVWGDNAPGAVESSLQSYVSNLRSGTGLAIERAGGGYRLPVDEQTTIDAIEFERGVTRAASLADTDPGAARHAIREALTLRRSTPYSDLPGTPGLDPEIARLESLHRSALKLSMEVNMTLDDLEGAMQTANQLLAEDPFEESVRGQQMIILYRQGRQAAALSLYQTVRRQLIDELGVEPGPALQTVERQILLHDPTLRPRVPGATKSSVPRNPYKGAEAFTEGDAGDFFGRDGEIDELIKLVSHHRLSLLVGPSGSGKSSLARAGLIPALTSSDISNSITWACQVMRLGQSPTAALDRALADLSNSAADQHLVIVDQFEELYSQVSPGKRVDFVDRITSNGTEGNSSIGDPASPTVRLLIVLRADFFHLPLMDRKLGPQAQQATMALSVPSAADLAHAIELPATSVGLPVDPAVTAQLVADVEGQTSALPLLQFTMTELAQSAGDSGIDLLVYRQHGGVLGAIGHRAAAVYDELDAEAQQAARTIFLHLVTVVDETIDVRRQVQRTDIENLDVPDKTVNQVLNRFGGARLLTFDHDPATGAATIEVSHEAILSEWPRLADWIDEERQNLIVRRRLHAACQDWIGSGEPDDFLPQGARLSEFQEWADHADTSLDASHQRFLRLATERANRLADRHRRRRRLLTSGLATVAIAMSVLAFLAVNNSRLAERQSNLAFARVLISDAEDNIDVDPELAIMLAVEAISIEDDSTEAVGGRSTDVLRRALAANKVLGQIPGGQALAIDPAGDRLYTAGEDGGLAAWDPLTQEKLADIPLVAGSAILSVTATSSDRLIAGLVRGPDIFFVSVQLTWDGDKLVDYEVDRVRTLELTEDEWVGTATSPDGTLLAVLIHQVDSSVPRTLEVWNLDGAGLLYRVEGAAGETAAFSPDSQRLAFSRFRSKDDSTSPVEIVVADASSGREELTIDPSFGPFSFAFSPDQDALAYNDPDQVGLADLVTGRELWTQSELSRASVPVWSDDGETITAGNEGLMARLSADDGSLLDPIVGDRGGVAGYGYVPGTDVLAIAGDDRVTLIDTSANPRPEIGGFASPMPTAWSLFVDHSGEATLQTFSEDYVVQKVNARDPIVSQRWKSAPNFWQFPVTSQDMSLFAGFVDDENLLWSMPDMEVKFRSSAGWSIRAVTNDGEMAALSREGEPAQLVEVETGRILHELDVGTYLFYGTFAADNRYLITSNNGEALPNWRIWDTASGKTVRTFGEAGDYGAVIFAMTPNDRQLVLGTTNGTVLFFDTAALIDGSAPDDAIVRRIEAHDQLIVQLIPSSDSKYLATNSWDEPAKIWDLDTGNKVAELGGTGEITGVTFHPTKNHVYVHDDGYVSIHTLDPDELIEIALETVTRSMSDEECLLYLDRTCP